MISRTIYPKLQKLYQKPDILALIGARRVGKTTLMTQLFEEEKVKSKLFLSFDDQRILQIFEEDIDEFIRIYIQNNEVVFIDEFQYASEGGKKLKYLYDKLHIKIVISGSSAPELTIQSLQYLVGRVFIEEIHPLSFEEFIEYKNPTKLPLLNKVTQSSISLIKPFLEEYLTYGGYPQVILENSQEDKILRLKQIVNTYLLKEIRDILQYKDSHKFEKLLSILAMQDGSIVNKSKLSSLLEISNQKLNEMIEVLEKTYVLTQVKPYTNTKVKELIKSPKIYFKDTGFKNYLLNEFKPISMRIDKGVLYENFILHSLLYLEQKVLFYNYKNSSEVDFLIQKSNNSYVAIEVKSYLQTPKVERGLYSYIV
ncbi:MAG: ATP-binding protein [Nanoarchaeota archaeon]|nr:ATP-binding protein [Nanoarchaeota archaeon]